MADIKAVFDQVVALGKAVASLTPQGRAVLGGVAVVEKIIDFVGDLTDKAPDTRTQEELIEVRKQLRAVTSAKAQSTADRLEGKG